MRVNLKTKFILYGAVGVVLVITAGTMLHDLLMRLGWLIEAWHFAVALGLSLLLLLIPLWQVLERWIFRPLSHIEAADRLVAERKMGMATIAESDIPPNEIGALMRSRNSMLSTLLAQQRQLEVERNHTKMLNRALLSFAEDETEEAFRHMLEYVCQYQGLEGGWILVRGNGKTPTRLVASHRLPSGIRDREEEFFGSPCRCLELWKHSPPDLSISIQVCQRFPDMGEERRILVVPLTRDSRALGAMDFLVPEDFQLTDDVQRFLESLATPVGLVLSREQVAEALRASEEKYLSLYLSMNEGVALHEVLYDEANTPIDYVVLDVNPGYEAITGIERAKAIGARSAELYGTDEPPYLSTFAGVAASGFSTTFETYFSPLDKHISISVFSPARGQFGTVVTDISDRHRIAERINAALKEKEVLLQEVYHRVKNNLQIVCSLLYHQASTTKDEEVRSILRESRDRVRSMALVHQELYQSADLVSIKVAKYLGTLMNNLFESYGVDAGRIALEMDADSVSLNIETAIPIGLILNELVSNALKYAFPDGRKGEISVGVHRTEDETFRLRVRDNGIGGLQRVDLKHPTTLGLRLVQDLCYQLGGHVEMHSNGGTVIEMTFSEVA